MERSEVLSHLKTIRASVAMQYLDLCSRGFEFRTIPFEPDGIEVRWGAFLTDDEREFIREHKYMLLDILNREPID